MFGCEKDTIDVDHVPIIGNYGQYMSICMFHIYLIVYCILGYHIGYD